MSPLEQIAAAAARAGRTIALSEGDDPRCVEGALGAARLGIARIILVGDTARVRAALAGAGGTGADVEIHDPAISPLAPRFAGIYAELRRHRGVSAEEAARRVREPLVYAALLVREGHADGTVGGAVATTAETVRTALQIIGPAPGSSLVSSFFLMLLPDGHPAAAEPLIFADCGLVIDPSPADLAQIARASAHSYATLLGRTPRVAMLSFSTAGSASHPAVDKVIEATRLVREAEPDLLVEGEVQFDAAFVPEIAARKMKGSRVAGRANVFIFPSLEAGNIGYKIAERIGRAAAIGPILQGLAKPANDLSRGCRADDVLNLVAMTAVQAGARG